MAEDSDSNSSVQPYILQDPKKILKIQEMINAIVIDMKPGLFDLYCRKFQRNRIKKYLRSLRDDLSQKEEPLENRLEVTHIETKNDQTRSILEPESEISFKGDKSSVRPTITDF